MSKMEANLHYDAMIVLFSLLDVTVPTGQHEHNFTPQLSHKT
jgi:hypothetical protein